MLQSWGNPNSEQALDNTRLMQSDIDQDIYILVLNTMYTQMVHFAYFAYFAPQF